MLSGTPFTRLKVSAVANVDFLSLAYRLTLNTRITVFHLVVYLCASELVYRPIRVIELLVITARSELRKVLFLAPSVCSFLFVYEIFREPLDGYAPNSHGRRVWSLAQISLKVRAKGQCHQGQKRYFLSLSAACVQFVFGKTSLASRFNEI